MKNNSKNISMVKKGRVLPQKKPMVKRGRQESMAKRGRQNSMAKREQFYKDRYLETMGRKAQYCRSGQDWVWFVPKKKRTKKELKPKKEMVIPKLEVSWGKYHKMTPKEKEEYALRPKGKWGQKKEIESDSDSDSDSDDEEWEDIYNYSIDDIEKKIEEWDEMDKIEDENEKEDATTEIDKLSYYCEMKYKKTRIKKWYKASKDLELISKEINK